jgi:hypothetical protein
MLRAVVVFGLAVIDLRAASAQSERTSPALRQAYQSTETLWAAVLRNNPALGPAEEFVRSLVAEIRATKSVPDFGSEFVKLLEGEQTYACLSFKLCEQKIVPAFRTAKPVGVTDIIQYVLESTCYGFVPERQNRLSALETINRVVRQVGYASLPLSEADKLYLRRDFSDALATAESTWGRGGRYGRYRTLRDWIQFADPRLVSKQSKGANRPLDSVIADAATSACR